MSHRLGAFRACSSLQGSSLLYLLGSFLFLLNRRGQRKVRTFALGSRRQQVCKGPALVCKHLPLWPQYSGSILLKLCDLRQEA